MRTLSGTLEAAQKLDHYIPLTKLNLTYGGSPSYEYTDESANPILDITHEEQAGSQTVEVIIQNHDNTLTPLSLKGYKGVISRGIRTGSGDEYSAHAPLWVIAKTCYSSQGVLICRLSLAGLPNILHEEKATDPFIAARDDTKTVKTIFREIAGDSGVSPHPSYILYDSHGVVFDSEDSLIDTFMPREAFRITMNDRRWDKLAELLNFTGCVMRVEGDGKIHVLVPTTSGESYDYEYELITPGEHDFFDKTYRQRLVMPNYIYVRSSFNDSPFYQGTAFDSASIAEIGWKFETHPLRLTSDAQAEAIADVILARYQLGAEGGSGKMVGYGGLCVHFR